MVENKEALTEEIKEEDKRSFFGPDEKTKYYIVAPTAENIRGADWQYSKIYTESLVEGITTSAEMTDILKRRGIIGPEFEQRARELQVILNEKILLLSALSDIDKKRETSIEVANAREELFQWNQRLNGPMSNTCEQIADDARLEYITSCIIADKDDKRVWEDFDSYRAEKIQALAMRSRFETMLYLQGLDSDFLDKTPEAQAMREVEEDLIDRAQEALNVAEAFRKEEEAKKEAKKKPVNKKVVNKKPAKKIVSKNPVSVKTKETKSNKE